ncbi:MAG: alpha-glucosidase [Leptospiraceae bacterium]|nr:alpha-glucosidase [Leptospiraceae bacterium]MCP5498074.1 alpha-glucosidase [Leptospiraceae bacterium]
MKKLLIFSLFLFLFYCSKENQLTIIESEVSLPTESNFILWNKSDKLLKIISKKLNKDFISFTMDRAFLSAAVSKPKVKYKIASFTFDESIVKKCNNQTISKIITTNQSIVIQGELKGDDCSSLYSIQFKIINDNQVEFDIQLTNKELNRIYLEYNAENDEQIFGFGEQFSHFNLKGKKLFIFTEEQGIGRGDQPITIGANIVAGAGGNEFTSYAPIPYYTTTENRSYFFENTSYSTFDFTDAGKTKVEFWEENLKGNIWVADDPLDLIQLYTEKTGRFPLLPDWAYGTWMGLQGGSEKTKNTVKEAMDAGNPVTVLWIQDWVGKRKTSFGSQLWWRWKADEKTYPNFKEFCTEMEQSGVKVLGYINSFLANEGEMFEEAKKFGYLVKNQKGEDYEIETAGFPAYLIDLTNPDAAKWTKEIIKKNMIEAGLLGWMADFGEFLPFDAKLHSGVSAELYHNIYPVDWARINREAIQEVGMEGKIVFFTRAGYSYSNKYSTLFWLGDQMVSFGENDGLPSTVTGMLSGGISGLALNHSDIGGYTTINNFIKDYHRSEELFQRWVELNAFTPIFRTHEGNRPEENHQSFTNPKTVEFFAKFGRIHFALKDYFKYLVDEAHKKGYPVIRPLYLHYPKDKNTYDLKKQFLVGQDILVIPVLEKGAEEVEGYFPAGRWENIWNNEFLKGGRRHTINTPIGKPAVFIKENGEWSEKIKNAIKESL